MLARGCRRLADWMCVFPAVSLSAGAERSRRKELRRSTQQRRSSRLLTLLVQELLSGGRGPLECARRARGVPIYRFLSVLMASVVQVRTYQRIRDYLFLRETLC